MAADSDFLFRSLRLGFRPFLPKDAAGFYQLNLDPDVIRYTGDFPFPSVEAAGKFIANYDAYRRWGFGRWAMIHLKTDEFIGFCGFKWNEEKQIDLGFRLMQRHWNQGLGTEAAKAAVDYGIRELGFTEIIGRANRSNGASIRILEKIGMLFWKETSNPELGDSVYYRMRGRR